MTTGEGGTAPRDGQSRQDGEKGRGDRIGVGGGDDSVSRIQLAARWAEAYAVDGDSLGGMLRRFRTAYDYLDAVIHGVEPPEMDSLAEVPASAAERPGPPGPPPWSNPSPQEPGAPPTEPRPWS
jgi:hypothetical protein